MLCHEAGLTRIRGADLAGQSQDLTGRSQDFVILFLLVLDGAPTVVGEDLVPFSSPRFWPIITDADRNMAHRRNDHREQTGGVFLDAEDDPGSGSHETGGDD